MAYYYPEPSHTFSEYLLIPGYTSEDCIPDRVSLKTPLVKYRKGVEEPALSLNVPLTSAVMQSVSNDTLAIALAKEGGISFIFGSQSIENQAAMVAKTDGIKATQGSVFPAGMQAVIAIFGIAWMGDTFLNGNMAQLTASIEDKVTGLDLGADDYLTKPFHLAELNARIKSVIRRKQQDGELQLSLANLTIYPDKHSVYINGKEIVLNRKEFDLLYYFISNPNRLISKATLAESVWGDYIDQADNFDFIYSQVKNCKNLNRKLKNASHKNKKFLILKTVNVI